MTKKENLINLINERNGYLLITEGEALGISRAYLQEFVKTNQYERVACGIYKAPDAWMDDLYVTSLKNNKAVFSFDTALMLHGLTEREPSEYFVTVSKSYNATHLKSKGYSINYVKDEWLDLGRTVAKTTYGNEVAVYDVERTICDMIRAREKKDTQMFSYAMKEYAKRQDKNLPKLIRYASTLGVEEEVRRYMEVLL